MPADRKGPLDLGVQVSNKVGMTAFAAGTVELVDVDLEKTAPGTITGTVVEGDRPQVGLTVVLTDEKNKKVTEQQTTAGGAFRFEKVPPGKYKVSAQKRSSAAPRTGKADADVKPGATVTVTIELFTS